VAMRQEGLGGARQLDVGAPGEAEAQRAQFVGQLADDEVLAVEARVTASRALSSA